jgi:hypothetical protein
MNDVFARRLKCLSLSQDRHDLKGSDFATSL